MSFVSFKTTEAETNTISSIVYRAERMTQVKDRMRLTMDITACHVNGTALDLGKLLAFQDFDFMHDVSGISANIDRGTGHLANCFLPRSAMGNPFRASGGGFWGTVEDRLHMAKGFGAVQCRAALELPDLQKTVRTAIERRLRKFERGGLK